MGELNDSAEMKVEFDSVAQPPSRIARLPMVMSDGLIFVFMLMYG
jgi:hypothetical protein